MAHEGQLYRGLTREDFVEKIEKLGKNEPITRRIKWRKGREKNEKPNL